MSDRSTTSSAIEAEIAILKQRLAERLEEEAEERRRVEEKEKREREEEEERRRMEEEEEERRRMEEMRWAEEEEEKEEFERTDRTMKILERPKAASTSKAKLENGSWPSFDIRRALTALYGHVCCDRCDDKGLACKWRFEGGNSWKCCNCGGNGRAKCVVNGVDLAERKEAWTKAAIKYLANRKTKERERPDWEGEGGATVEEPSTSTSVAEPERGMETWIHGPSEAILQDLLTVIKRIDKRLEHMETFMDSKQGIRKWEKSQWFEGIEDEGPESDYELKREIKKRRFV
ncbi:hypothetical protein FRC17_001753 [Serendipita sp. 399]|nr:hypothetical protein FRC17_001753 [Serendipita sp. 399]